MKQEHKPETIVVVGEDGKEVEERVIPEFGIRMGLPDDVDLMIEAKGACAPAAVPAVRRSSGPPR